MKKPKRTKHGGGAKRGAAGTPTRRERQRSDRPRAAKSTPPVDEELEALAEMLGLIGSAGLAPPRTPLEKAEELVAEAYMSDSKRRRERLARKALEMAPDCADAYVLMAIDAPGPAEARPLLERAIEVAERALGPRPFREDVGNFWLLLETRPYMRARELLAYCLWRLGEREQAVAHYQELLRLNPNDNQGIRYVLAQCYLEMEREEELARLLAAYAEDASAVWMYTAALLAFRRKGPTSANGKKLAKAVKDNPFVPDYLLGRKQLPGESPDLIGWGDESEAIDYAAAHKTFWERTPHALDWLRYALGGWVLPPEHWPKSEPESPAGTHEHDAPGAHSD